MHLINRVPVGLFEHLAAEEILLNGAGPGVPVLMIWRGPRGVVMGKNQNPWRECNLDVIRERGLLLGRRVSGGGTVYHDPGNLNFSWVLERKVYRPDLLHGILRDALGRLGLRAETAATGGMLVRGRKVSGAAYCYRQERVLHHGTLLWHADLPTMRAALSAPRVRLTTHAVSSVPARVENLADMLSGLEPEDLVEALIASGEAVFGQRRVADLDSELLGETCRRFQSDDWIRGQTPRFVARVDLDGETLEVSVRRGRVERVVQGADDSAVEDAPWFGMEMFPVLSSLTGIAPDHLLEAFARSGWNFNPLN
jgi:lipoate-protein ligase A